MNEIFLIIEIFFARIIDVCLGTMRTIYLTKHKNILASLVAFIEIIIWFYVARKVLVNNDLNFILVISYALGYSFGTYLGSYISKIMLKINYTIMIVSKYDFSNILKINKFGFTTIKLNNNYSLYIIETTNKRIKQLNSLIVLRDNKAFIVINESSKVTNGYI